MWVNKGNPSSLLSTKDDLLVKHPLVHYLLDVVFVGEMYLLLFNTFQFNQITILLNSGFEIKFFMHFKVTI